jgi:hypothetical protein
MSIKENIRKDLDTLQKRVSEQDFASAAEALRRRKYAQESAAFQKILRQRQGWKKRVRAVPTTHVWLGDNSSKDDLVIDDGHGYYTDVQQQKRTPLPPPQKKEQPQQQDDGYGYYTDVQQQKRTPVPPPQEKEPHQRCIARPSIATPQKKDYILDRLQRQYLAQQLAALLERQYLARNQQRQQQK